jgi:histidine ammonia-lyase
MAAVQQPVVLDTSAPSTGDVVQVARHGAPVRLSEQAQTAIKSARTAVDELAASATPAYGISTGFGALATRHIHEDMRARLQVRAMSWRSRSCGP